MTAQEAALPPATVEVENIGGIEETSVTVEPGVTLLVGRNASNRTSFLRALMAALGSDQASLKADADEGAVELAVGDERYRRALHRRSGSVSTDGDAYLENATPAELFAFLLESNPARRAVARGDDLRELMMRPVDTEAIEAEIDRLLAERRELEAELEEVRSLADRLPELEAERSRLEDELEAKAEQLAAKEAELDAVEGDVEATREERDELESRLEALREQRSTLDDVRFDLETERASRSDLEDEREALQAELDGLPEAPAGELETLEEQLRDRRERKQRIEREVNELQSVIGFNEERLAEGGPFGPVEDGAVTDRLVEDRDVTCWTCGSSVESGTIRETIDRLRELSAGKLEDADALDDEIDALQDERRDLQASVEERDRIERRLEEVDDELEATRETIERLEGEREELEAEVEAAEAEIESLEHDAYDELLALHRETTQLQYDVGKLENELERVESNIATIESRLDEEDELVARRESVQEEIEARRTEMERIERTAIDRFNEHMEEVLTLLGYDNLDRIWIERVERPGRGNATEPAFELNVIRSTATGTAYADEVSNLSESEREVTGLVFALAGYLAHEVYEELPFMLLDSLEAIDAERLATFVDYLGEFADYLVVALLPEDAAGLDDSYQRITEI